jgi:hypothetical protein
MNAMTPLFDWRRALLHGITLAAENHRDFDEPEPWTAMWSLLCEAAEVSRSYNSPPRRWYPSKAAWPDVPDEITHWQKQMAYIQGTLDEVGEDDPTPPMPSAAEVTRADAVLDLWHRHALRRGDNPHPMKRHIWSLAEGAPIGLVIRNSGMKRDEVLAMRAKAATQMLRAAGVE